MKPQWLLLLWLLLFSSGCLAPRAQQGDIAVTIHADGQTHQLTLPAGSRVRDALAAAGITLDGDDQVSPDLPAALTDGSQVEVIRITESFSTEIVSIPFERQVIQSESLPVGEQRLVQAGENGQREYTYRHVYRNGVEEGEPTIIKSVLLKEPVAEILLVGVQSTFLPLSLPGKIAYLAAGNAWIMEDSTANRRLLVATGDLDGRIFFLSPDGKWLIFTRQSDLPPDQGINTLWAIDTTDPQAQPFYLKADNVVHFVGWHPRATQTLYFSTVEPRAAVPGWQANNDLWRLRFGSGWATSPVRVVDASSGGIYGWWGTNYLWAENGALAYLRPDGIGLVDLQRGTLRPLLSIPPYQTSSDWAWVPGAAFSPNGAVLYFVNHDTSKALSAAETSPYFNLEAILPATGTRIVLAENTGMFASPALSPDLGNGQYQLAFLQAIFPTQSERSRYRLVLMDRDGSERRTIFPPANQPGLQPQRPLWAPAPNEQGTWYLAVLYNGNLWLLESETGAAHQVTGDGLIARLDWR